MTVENDITDGSVQAACAVKDVEGEAFLRADGDGVNDGGVWIVALQAPLVVVQMEDMSFFDATVDQADFDRIPYVGTEDRRCRVSINPGAHGDILSGIPMFISKRAAVSHWLGAIADGCSRGWEVCVGIMISEFVIDNGDSMRKVVWVRKRTK